MVVCKLGTAQHHGKRTHATIGTELYTEFARTHRSGDFTRWPAHLFVIKRIHFYTKTLLTRTRSVMCENSEEQCAEDVCVVVGDASLGLEFTSEISSARTSTTATTNSTTTTATSSRAAKASEQVRKHRCHADATGHRLNDLPRAAALDLLPRQRARGDGRV
jgi:hypothetical protein